VQELRKHLNGRTNGFVFQTRNGTSLLLSNLYEDELRPRSPTNPASAAILDELGMWKEGMGMHSFRRGRMSQWVYAGVNRQVIRDWVAHSADRLIDLYTRRMKQYHAAEIGKSNGFWTQSWTQKARRRLAHTPLSVVKSKSCYARFPGSSMVEHSAVNFHTNR